MQDARMQRVDLHREDGGRVVLCQRETATRPPRPRRRDQMSRPLAVDPGRARDRQQRVRPDADDRLGGPHRDEDVQVDYFSTPFFRRTSIDDLGMELRGQHDELHGRATTQGVALFASPTEVVEEGEVDGSVDHQPQ